MTNPFRPVRLASPRVKGEAQRPVPPRGCVGGTETLRWLGTEWSEGRAREAGRSRRSRREPPREVRAPIVARKPGNARWSEGVQESGYVDVERCRKNHPRQCQRLSKRKKRPRPAERGRNREVWTDVC